MIQSTQNVELSNKKKVMTHLVIFWNTVGAILKLVSVSETNAIRPRTMINYESENFHSPTCTKKNV